MKVLCVLLLAVLCGGTLATAQNPYPVGCWTFSMETYYCSDVHPGAGCLGSLDYVIVTPIGATGSDFGTYSTLACTVAHLTAPERIHQPVRPVRVNRKSWRRPIPLVSLAAATAVVQAAQ
jgi:hypothetical protein